MEERALKMFGIFLLTVFAITVAAILYSQHERREFAKEVLKYTAEKQCAKQ